MCISTVDSKEIAQIFVINEVNAPAAAQFSSINMSIRVIYTVDANTAAQIRRYLVVTSVIDLRLRNS